MTVTLALSLVVGLVTMLSIELIAHRKRAGFLVGLGAQAPWVVLDLRTENALCMDYSTADGTYRRGSALGGGGAILALSSRDGLAEPWSNRRVFMNPPYSRELLAKTVRKAYEEREDAAIIVALLPFDPSLRWWNAYIGEHHEHAIVLPLRKRLHYIGTKSGATFPSCVVIWRKELL